MANLFDNFNDTRAMSGVGTQLNVWNETLQKYSLLIPLETVPSVAGSTDTIEIDLTTSNIKGKIEGKKSIDDKDSTFLLHRDNLRRLQALVGKQLQFLVSNPDFTGTRYEGKIVYRQDDATSDKLTGTMTIIANKIQDAYVEDVRDMLAHTCLITSVVPNIVNIAKSGTYTLDLVASTSTATFTAESNVETVTASISGKVLTITGGSADANAIIVITSSATGMASWETTIAVTVA